MQVNLTITLPGAVGADYRADWLRSTKATGTLGDGGLASADTAVTLGQALAGIQAGDAILIGEEIAEVFVAPEKDSSTLALVRPNAVDHPAHTPVSILMYPSPFSRLLIPLRRDAQEVTNRLAEAGVSQTFAASVAGVVG